jgi:hypothetical protein
MIVAEKQKLLRKGWQSLHGWSMIAPGSALCQRGLVGVLSKFGRAICPAFLFLAPLGAARHARPWPALWTVRERFPRLRRLQFSGRFSWEKVIAEPVAARFTQARLASCVRRAPPSQRRRPPSRLLRPPPSPLRRPRPPPSAPPRPDPNCAARGNARAAPPLQNVAAEVFVLGKCSQMTIHIGRIHRHSGTGLIRRLVRGRIQQAFHHGV